MKNGSDDGTVGGMALSRREIEVIRLAAKGFTSRQTAEELGTSARTVESQRESIKRKLRVDSLTQAAVAFVLSTSGTTPPNIVETLKYFCGIARIMETLMMRSGIEYHEPADRIFA